MHPILLIEQIYRINLSDYRRRRKELCARYDADNELL